MIKLSAIVISKNSEETIARCIQSISFADEIIIVDGGSTDKSISKAKKLGVITIDCGNRDFSSLRNIGARHAKGQWLLYIDTDEIVTLALKEKILKVIRTTKFENAAFTLKRKNFYFGAYEWPYIEKLERLFLKEKLLRWEGVLHETAYLDGNIGKINEFILHYTHKDLFSMVEKTNSWSMQEALLRFKIYHPIISWWRFLRVMITAFWNSYVTQYGWRVGMVGILESMYQAFSIFITYAKLWEMQNNVKIKATSVE